ncbi:G-type lectin S-receptor-like serine/threonine-protein kinase At4g27290 isoform X1 [Ricinus communis]|uniref:G-type lectin S-receptor-like serine/threonine-protein kinase At4g27290 isoform X1 n=1 Tax=Ricinus communis TaxID=3988 RepID=UPI00201A3C0E|nr:G-type lectin S-receptor-like serine/threonine-protein kinase At4g27290 isoform X1 [Ricinus communis]
MEDNHVLLIVCFCFSLITVLSAASDTINTTQFIRDGEALVSAGESFRLGFFSPGTSKNRYLGIWYDKVSVLTVVWVANREIPLTDLSGVLKITDQGILFLLNHNETIIWFSNSTRSARNPVAQLLDSGNFVVRNEEDDNPDHYLWQSFDYPSDTMLPEMKFGWDKVTGLDRYITSWKTPDDPSQGNFTYGFVPTGYPEKIMREGLVTRFRSGPWNGRWFCGVPQLKPNVIYSYNFTSTEKEIYYMYHLLNSSRYSRVIIDQYGIVRRFVWTDAKQGWVLYLTAQTDNCDTYALCGAYGSCNINSSPVCSCLKGFAPKSKREWDMLDWSNGCVRETLLNCSGDGFQKYSELKLPETKNSWFNKSMNLEDCKIKCLKNCSCIAYANLDIREGGSGCLHWFDELIDMRKLDEYGQDIYIRMAASELDKMINAKPNANKQVRIIVITVTTTGILFASLALVLCVWKRKKQRERKVKGVLQIRANNKSQKENLDLPLFDFDTIAFATNSFSTSNVLGEGGFGTVYKGMLKDGQVIAVKRLSRNSDQGFDEFKNEVMHIAKLQHRNLVKLLGYCIQADEQLLIYEFMPNKSLDFFIFANQSTLLDWPRRCHVINGIARGLLYLHQDSRLRIIHRDLKAGNILLDHEMNPKISDFGLARSFRGSEMEANTNKVVGTYGYMSPEYAIKGLYSAKSDVFSFGVMVLEIVSGQKNRGFCHPEHHHNLLGHAWRLYKEGRCCELIAASVRDTCNLSEALRSAHIGLLCVQRSPEDRPSMSAVVLMLGGEGPLPEPKQPGFFTEGEISEASSTSGSQKPCSLNVLTITTLAAR